ncbi:hypothetical protein CSW98_06740 [Vibrio sp. HA2012]|uniref:LysR family transcriptional regulator n=1 Tax=Vibrio sp. HA2012 TaxID=1971595 RepID=UPI000C2B8312|nr:LysR family transcriptional regulator [Vibrio sp. HA2012]PJC86685.1 hypothetical protein CSW98_06740 [Vibrio sp. HA2012]
MSNLKAMRTLLAIRDYGSLTMAAEYLDEPKSTLSRRICILESELDARLTCQTGRRLSLTQAGLCYADVCEQILQLDSDGREAVRTLKSELSGHVSVGLATELSRGWSTESLHRFANKHPGIELEIQIMECSNLASDAPVDLWLSCCNRNEKGVKSIKLGIWQQALYASVTDEQSFNFDKLEEQHWICGQEQGTSIFLHSETEQATLIPKHKTLISSLHMRADAISQGFGIGLLPRWIAECKKHGIKRYQRVFPEFSGQDVELWLHYKVEKESLFTTTLRQWLLSDIPVRWK